MILVDALYINKGGGLILLKYFINNIPKSNGNLFFLLDKRVENEFKNNDIKVFYLKGSIIKRHFFYRKYKNKFSLVFTFANLPPTIKLDCKVLTFFQNILLVDDKFISIKYQFKKIIFNFLVRNTDLWIVQSDYVRKVLQNKIGQNRNIQVFPFFEESFVTCIKTKRDLSKIADIKFIFASSGEVHKNHEILFKAFAHVNKMYPNYSLIVTVGSEYPNLISIIKDLNNRNINIINVGNISREELYSEYSKADICVYPSLKESFGLGLIEAVQFGLPIFASDLPYVKDVVQPSCFFNPFNEQSIASTMLNYNAYINNEVKIVAKNNIKTIYNLLGFSS